MWPEFKNFSIVFENTNFNEINSYDDLRQAFTTSMELCKGLISDIGWGDMIFTFDNEDDLNKAVDIISKSFSTNIFRITS